MCCLTFIRKPNEPEEFKKTTKRIVSDLGQGKVIPQRAYVTDTNCGIPLDEKQTVFESYYKKIS